MNLVIYVNRIEEKQTIHTKKEATRNTKLFEMVHTTYANCRPFDVNYFNKGKSILLLY